MTPRLKLRSAPLVLCCALFSAVACTSQIPPETLIKQDSELATIITLQESNTSVTEADRVAALAIATKTILLEEKGSVNYEVLKAEIYGQIVNTFDPPLKITLVILANNIAEIVMAEIKENGLNLLDKDGQFVLFLVNAADGVESGVNIYIAAYGPTLE